jgi:hypothetical protein
MRAGWSDEPETGDPATVDPETARDTSKSRIDGPILLSHAGRMIGYPVMSRAGSVVLAVIATTGCTRTFRASTVQPNPLAEPTETLRQSEKITIVTGDMELEKPDEPEPTQRATMVRNNRYPLYNQASFTIVSRDRPRRNSRFAPAAVKPNLGSSPAKRFRLRLKRSPKTAAAAAPG